jgi:hypothetical protein
LRSEITEPNTLKRPNAELNGKSNNNASPPIKIRRIQPLKIGEVTSGRKMDSDDESNGKNKVAETVSKDTLDTTTSSDKMNTSQSDDQQNDEAGPSTKADDDEKQPKNEETKELKVFIKECRRAENNDDMKKIIKKKLLKNYHLVSSSYVLSQNFRNLLKDTANEINRDPKRVYSKIQDVVHELEVRKHTKIELAEMPAPPESAAATQGTSEEASQENGIESTGDKKKDAHLKKLNKALGMLKKKIDDLEEAEVNLDDDDDSAYMQKVRYEKRAIEIYNKICELTNESSHAHRIVKKPIKFKESKFKEFNSKLAKKVNRENGFPSYYDVYRLLDYCNKEHKYRLSKREIEDVAQSTFQKVGQLLKERRGSDLWESHANFLGENKVKLLIIFFKFSFIFK